MTIQEVLQQFADLKAAFDEAATDVAAYVTKLKAQVAAGTAVTQEQLDALGTGMAALKTQVTTFDVNNSEAPIVVPPIVP